MESETECLLGPLNMILEMSDLEVGLKVEKWEIVLGDEGE